MGALFLDFIKAFDVVDHEILLTKLCNYGVNKNSIKWFSSYLHDRYPRVSIETSISDPQHPDSSRSTTGAYIRSSVVSCIIH